MYAKPVEGERTPDDVEVHVPGLGGRKIAQIRRRVQEKAVEFERTLELSHLLAGGVVEAYYKILKAHNALMPSEEETSVLNETDELQQQLAVLNAKADAAQEAGDREAYDALVDQMIELENTHLDAGGELPLPRHKDQEDDIIASFPSSRPGEVPDVITRGQQDEFDRHQAAWKDFNKRNRK